MNHETINHFANHLQRERHLEQCASHLRAVLAQYRIHMYAFTYYAYYPGSPNKLKYDTAADGLRPWHQLYIANGYDKIDSTVALASKTNLPIIWTLAEQLAQAKTPLERQMRADSIAFGVERGISVPIHGPDGDYAEFVVQQRRGEVCLQDSQRVQYDILAIGHIYYENIRRLLIKNAKDSANASKYALSKRELQCLMLAAQRYTVQEIAHTLCLTERTINFHFQRINKKLGTKNKYHSLTKAISEQLINL